MKKLLLLDYQDYSEEMPVFTKHTVRGIILRDGKLAMQRGCSGEFKILGGVVEEGEDHETALMREIMEEAGLIVDADSIQPIGYVEERRRDVFCTDRVYHCFTYFYACQVMDKTVEPELTECEKQKGYQLIWEVPERILEANCRIIKERWKMRDTEFIKMMTEGKLL